MSVTMKSRNMSIERLRILLMLAIVALHFMSHGGGIALSSNDGIANGFSWLIESIAYYSVNGFVLITGYFQSAGTLKKRKLLDLILQITFWSLVCYGITILTGTETFSLKVFIKATLPWLFGEYWFPTVYLGLYLLSPYLNKLIENTEQQEYRVFLCITTGLYCLPFIQVSLRIGGGMGLLWFCHLYLTAGYYRRFGISLRKRFLITVLILCTLILWLPNVVNGVSLSYLKSYVWNYYSLPTFIGSTALFLIFAASEDRRSRADRLIQLVSSLTFGVFLIHDNNHFRVYLWNTISCYLPQSGFTVRTLWMIPVIILSVFIICSCLEYLRQRLFLFIKTFGKLLLRTGRT